MENKVTLQQISPSPNLNQIPACTFLFSFVKDLDFYSQCHIFLTNEIAPPRCFFKMEKQSVSSPNHEKKSKTQVLLLSCKHKSLSVALQKYLGTI